jgi:hypothetical protein
MITDGEGCPVPEELIGRLYGSPMHRIDGLVSTLAPGPRGSLAAFCYGRAHLRNIGLAIAATCDLETLVNAGGRAGNSLFAASRERPTEPPRPFSWSRRSRITLATTGSDADAASAAGADLDIDLDTDDTDAA